MLVALGAVVCLTAAPGANAGGGPGGAPVRAAAHKDQRNTAKKKHTRKRCRSGYRRARRHGRVICERIPKTFVKIPCSQLTGTGTPDAPLSIGVVRRPTLVTGCPSLGSDAPESSSRYFSFTLARAAKPGSFLGAQTQPSGGPSTVHPLIATPSGQTIASSASDGFFGGSAPRLGRYLRLVPVGQTGAPLARGLWILGVQNLDSPPQPTADFDVVIYLY